ncbi:MAG: hypothetical protein ACOVQC_04720 [Flavobacterium sp.]
MKINFYIVLILSLTILSSFSRIDKFDSELKQLQKFELLALKNNKIGKNYTYDLTKNKGCNKTTIKYLGVIKTNKGKQYKILNSFFVYSVASTCHGTSSIKIYDMKNNYVGNYNVGMPNDLPNKITENKLICWVNSKDCNLRKGFSISFEKGLPKSFFLPCTENGGDEFRFSDE